MGDGESEPYLIGTEEEGEETGFQSASRKTYIIRAPHLGPLTRVAIRQLPNEEAPAAAGEKEDSDEEEAEPGDWYLERIVIVGPDGESWNFPFSNWVGGSRAGSSLVEGTYGQSLGSPEHTLVPHSLRLSSMRDPRYNYKARPLQVAAGAFSIPHVEKVERGVRGVNHRLEGHAGEDAYVIAESLAQARMRSEEDDDADIDVDAREEGAEEGSADEPGPPEAVCLAVFDGVYAWRSKGVDAGDFSRALAAGCREAVRGGAPDALSALRSAGEAVRRAGTRGSATACIAMVHASAGLLTTANLGDSGWMLLSPGSGSRGPAARRRPRALQARSPQQEHSFGYPFQLGSQEGADQAEDALVGELPLLPGSTVVLGTDGLFDNLEDAAIVGLVDDLLERGKRPAEVARALVFEAWKVSVDKQRETPYSRAARDAFDMIFDGGKEDDITALVAVVA